MSAASAMILQRVLQHTAGKEGRLLLIHRLHTSVDLLHRAGFHQIGNIGTDGVHGNLKMVAQLLHGHAAAAGNQLAHMLSAVLFHAHLSFRNSLIGIFIIILSRKIVNSFYKISKSL